MNNKNDEGNMRMGISKNYRMWNKNRCDKIGEKNQKIMTSIIKFEIIL